MTNIEDTFKPETATEIALLNRIRELRIQLYERCNFEGVSYVPREIEVPYEPIPSVQVSLAASVVSGWENEKLVIQARSYGPDKASIGGMSYVSREQLNGMSPGHAVRMLDALHRDFINRLSKHVMTGE